MTESVSAPPAALEGQLPPLPESHINNVPQLEDENWHGYTADQMREYARAALSSVTPAVPTPMELAAENEQRWRESKACLLCGVHQPHEHDRVAWTIYRNGMKRGLHGTEQGNRPHDPRTPQDGRNDAGATSAEGRVGADEHHQHRARESDPDGTHDQRDSRRSGLHGVGDVSASSTTPASVTPVAGVRRPLPGALVIKALLAMDAEARKRGEMFPQTADEQREDTQAVRKVIKSLEFYTGPRQCSADGWPSVKDWPALSPQEGVAQPDGEEWESAAREVVANPRPLSEIRADINALREGMAGTDGAAPEAVPLVVGMKLVPIEPTPEMLDAAGAVDGQSDKLSRAIYVEMLAAAPAQDSVTTLPQLTDAERKAGATLMICPTTKNACDEGCKASQCALTAKGGE